MQETHIQRALNSIKPLVRANLFAYYNALTVPSQLQTVPSQTDGNDLFLEFCQSVLRGDEPSLSWNTGDDCPLLFGQLRIQSYLTVVLRRQEDGAPLDAVFLFYCTPGGFDKLDAGLIDKVVENLRRLP